MSLLTVIQKLLGEKPWHTTMSLTKRNKCLAITKIHAQGVG